MHSLEFDSDGFAELDTVLRGTDVDPQSYADETGLTIIADEDAAETGWNCWYGRRGADTLERYAANIVAASDEPLTIAEALSGARLLVYTPVTHADLPM